MKDDARGGRKLRRVFFVGYIRSIRRHHRSLLRNWSAGYHHRFLEFRSELWVMADFSSALPTFVNLFALFFLTGKFFELIKDYKARYLGIGQVDPIGGRRIAGI